MKELRDLLYKAPLKELFGDTQVKVKDFHFDSRKIQPGDLFIAIPGTQTDGHQYITQAIKKGAIAIVCENLPNDFKNYPQVQWLVTSNSRQALGIIASNYYDNPSEKLKVVGVTGTNGKTTVATLLYRLFTELGYPSGLISTVEIKILNQTIPAELTTPDAKSLQHLFYEMVNAGCEYCFMEVSSIAVHQYRIEGTHFVGGIFTNLTHDHLDYHKTFENYLKRKKAFFDKLSSKAFAISNLDDKNGEVMLQNTRAKRIYYAKNRLAHYNVKVLENTFEGLHLILDGRELWVPLIGEFNAYNILAVYTAAKQLGIPSVEILKKLSLMTPIKGRFQILKHSVQPKYAVIDYAHTPDALKNVLHSLKQMKINQLIVVFGCGGNRDKEKRPIMGKIAAEYADKIIITSDNPRNENPKEIIEEILKGIPTNQRNKVTTLVDREEAIETALKFAQNHDVVLIAGKGHETYQEINGLKIPFDDAFLVQKFFNQI